VFETGLKSPLDDKKDRGLYDHHPEISDADRKGGRQRRLLQCARDRAELGFGPGRYDQRLGGSAHDRASHEHKIRRERGLAGGWLPVAVALPYSPMVPWLGFVPLSAALVGALALVTVAYLVLVHVVKRWFFKRAMQRSIMAWSTASIVGSAGVRTIGGFSA
jgi:hypothetical protein